MLTINPQLNPTAIAAANILGHWLAADDFTHQTVIDTRDIIVLAGNAVIPAIDAACQLAAENNIPLVITGGIGHSTTFLYSAIASHPRYNNIPTTGRPEADILADIAHQFWKVPAKKIYRETHSTNCGENATMTRNLLAQLGLSPRRVILVQDPTMQRRSAATFARAWRGEEDQPEWCSFPGIIPVLAATKQGARFSGDNNGMWPVDRYLSLIMGEIPRIRDDANGYGPQGRDFIEHVDMPESVDAAWRQLADDPQVKALLAHRALP